MRRVEHATAAVSRGLKRKTSGRPLRRKISDSRPNGNKLRLPADGFGFVLLLRFFPQAHWDFKIRSQANTLVFQSLKVLQSLLGFFVVVSLSEFQLCVPFLLLQFFHDPSYSGFKAAAIFGLIKQEQRQPLCWPLPHKT